MVPTSTAGTIVVDGDSVGFLLGIRLSSSDAALITDGFPPHVRELDLRMDRLRRSLGFPGDGPGDIQNIHGVFATSDGIWGYDIGRVVFVELHRENTPQNGLRRRLVRGPGMMTALTPLDDSTVVALSAGAYGITVLPNATVTRVNLISGRVSWYGEDRPAIDRSVDSLVPRSRRYLREQGFGCADTSRRRFLRGNLLSTIVEVVAMDDGRVIRNWRGPYDVSPPIIQTPAGRFVDTDAQVMRAGYIACAADRDGVWVAFSGANMRAPKDAPLPASTELHRYDWNGRLIRMTVLSPAIADFAVTDDGRTLFGVGHDRVSLLRFHLDG
jgi:hypothetical protein